MRVIVAASLVLASLTASARAAAPDIGALVGEMRSALEPARPSIRKLTLRMRGESGETSQVTVGQVRGTVASNSRILNVVLAPGSLRGIGYLAGPPARTDIDVSAVRYDVSLPEGLLEPAQLPDAAASPFWSELGG